MEFKEITSAQKTIVQREAWVGDIFVRIKNFISKYGDKGISTCSSLCTTSLKNSYVRGQVFPFINIPIRYRDKELLGFYEYFGEQLAFSPEFIYCDFIVHSLYYAENKDVASLQIMEKKAKQFFRRKGYKILHFEDGMATISVPRRILDQEDEFTSLLKTLLDDAKEIQAEVY